jgi:chemotaxis protein CheD
MSLVIVGVGDCRWSSSREDVLVTYALGSCIAIAIHDAEAGVGGLLHYMLPDSSIDSAKARQNPFMFADIGIPLLFRTAYERGAEKKRLRVWAAGAAQVMKADGIFNIGKRNYLSMRRIFWKAGVLVQHEEIGGTASRTLRLEMETGRVLLREGACTERDMALTRTGMAYRVLIVDDSPAMRSFMRRAIGLSGVDAVTLEAKDGRDALQTLEREWVDAILTDINMPEMDGEQMLTHLAENDLLRSVPVIVVSTDGTELRMRRMISLGARGYVRKPFLPETLREELERVLGVAHA